MCAEKRINASTKIRSDSIDGQDFVSIDAGEEYDDYTARLSESEVNELIQSLLGWVENRSFKRASYKNG